jgi:hypothetical protein
MTHLRAGHDLEVLWLGKMALADAPLVEELRSRQVLVQPTLRPGYLDDPAARSRLRRAATITSLGDLIGEPA